MRRGLAIALGGLAVAAQLGCGLAKADPTLQEDDPGWSCVDDGNRICGPGNPQGAPAGCYDDGGVLVAAWPCHVVVDANGDGDVYEGLASGPNAWDAGAYVGGYN